MTKLKNAPIMSWLRKSASSCLTIMFVFLAIWMMVTPMWGRGFTDKRGNILKDSQVTSIDSGVHLSLIEEIKNRFPPTNFADGGIPLKNYHYIYDTILAILSIVTGISVMEMYLRFAPIILSGSLALVIYEAVRHLTNNQEAAIWGIFITIFSTSFGFLTPAIKSILHLGPAPGTNNLFLADQIFDMMVNPQGVLSLIVFLSLFLLLGRYRLLKQKKYLVIYALVLGISFGVKAYGGVVLAGGSVIAAFWVFVKDRKWEYLAAVVGGLVIMGAWMLLVLDGRMVGITFAPLWTLDKLMVDYERLREPMFGTLLAIYKLHNNWVRIGGLYLLAFAIFIVGSLGLRIFGFVEFIREIINLNKLSAERVFLWSSALVSLVIPLLFNQGKKPYDIVQFLPYFTVAMGIGTTMYIFKNLSFFKGRFFYIGLGLLVLFTMVSDSHELFTRWKLVAGNSVENPIVVDVDTALATKWLKEKTPEDSIVLLSLNQKNTGSLWFTSLAGRRTVYSGRFFNYQVGVNTTETEKGLLRYFNTGIGKVKYDYIFAERRDGPQFDRIMEQERFNVVFSNYAVTIYQKI